MIDKLKHLNIVGSIVVMSDFFVDRIVKLKSPEELLAALNEKAKRGGGSVRGFPTQDIKGGNAVNVAYCLARLGVKVTLFTVADKMGNAVIRQAFSQFGERVDLRISEGKHGLTTSFEFPYENSPVNVMISDVGDNANFGPEKINSEADMKILKNADAVMVVNWASNIKGTALAEHAFKSSPSALHFIDPADIESRKQDFRDSLSKLASVTDILCINENECNSLGDVLGLGHLVPAGSCGPDDVKRAAKSISEKSGITTDLHTTIGSAWSNGRESVFAHAIKVQPRILTGAGDCWDAASVISYLAGLEPQERLLFANACASLYVRSENAEPPTMEKIFELVERIQ
jgi:ribokinase